MNFTLIAKAICCPQSHVEFCWPRILLCLEALGLDSLPVRIAALATTAVETAWTFLPIHEYGSDKYLNRLYDTRTDLGNTPELDGDGAQYCGRGFIQITGKSNYESYGRLIGIDLELEPNRAMDVDVAAQILAAFFRDHHVKEAAEAGDWKKVRRIINGGTNGLEDFLACVERLQAIPKGEV